MIKYVELTAPEASAYRQAKILSIELNEGDYVKAGDALFMVQSGNTKLELPATKEGRIVEFIVSEQENITLSTPLLLLETEVESSTATPPLEQKIEAPAPKQAMSIDDKQLTAHHEQQSLDLLVGLNESIKEPEETAMAPDLDLNQDEELEHATHKDTTEINSMSEMKLLSVNVPDIGADSAKVIEILVNIGDEITVEDALLTLESDKASMDVPSPYSGVVKTILVAIDQDVSEGIALIELEVTDINSDTASLASAAAAETTSKSQGQATEPSAPLAHELAEETRYAESEQVVSIAIPDIGGDSAKVVDILVSVGDEVAVEDALVTLESDKASMDVPSTTAGVIQSIEVSVDDDVSEGTVVATIVAKVVTNVTASVSSTCVETSKVSQPSSTATKQEPPLNSAPAAPIAPTPAASQNSSNTPNSAPSHASPSIRRFARELGVDLAKVNGTGRKSRIIKDDVKNFVKASLAEPAGATANLASGSGAGIPAVPAQDFSKFGDIEVTPLNKIKRLTANNLHRSWLNVPHVTHNDESNINDLEAFRKQLNAEYKAQDRGIKLSPLAFIVKAVVNALQSYPQFNSSLEPGGENLILKKYFHIGIAVETPNGLVVPVIRDADTKSVAQIAKEMGELAEKARDKKLTMNDMSGACFTISSLGGIGGTSFTPIVNAPEVAILGVSRSKIQPVWNGEEFIPGMMLPLSLSYDHRVIDGAEAARFTRHIAAVLEDVRRLTV